MKAGKERRSGTWVVNTAFITFICIPIILLVLCFIGGILVIAYEDKICANNLNNPIINTDYKNWSTVELINEETIMLPDGWSVTTDKSITVITDTSGNVVAKGGKLEQGENSSYQYEPLLGEMLGHPISDVTLSPSKNVRTSEYGIITIADDAATEYNYILLAYSGSYDMLFVFDPITTETHKNLTDILEAIIFSYVWK